MKRIFILLSLILTAGLFLVGCSNNKELASDNISVDDSTKKKSENETINTDNKSIVIYFSRTNNTEKIANYIVELTNSDSYEIIAKIPYTDDDIKYYTNCRADREQADPNARVEIGSDKIDISGYETIYLGYPIWHGEAPRIMYTFVESYDLKNKTIIPFCTSGSSPIGSSATKLSNLKGEGTWKAGKRFSSSDDKNTVNNWLNELN